MAKSASKKASLSTVPITPLGDRALIRPLSEEEMGTRSPAGIIIPETASEQKSDRGMVLAVGEGRVGDDNKRIPLSVKKGDAVLFQWGEKVEVAEETYYLVREDSILGIINA